MRQTIGQNRVAGAGGVWTDPLPWALTSLSLSMLMPSLDTGIANIGLPTLAQAFAASFQAVQWVLLAYLLAITSLIVGAGRLGDLLGRKRLLQIGIGLFTAASLLCGAAQAFWQLLAARALQGLGAAIMMAMTVALVGATVPRERTGSAMGLLGTMSAIGTMLGPSLGGMLIQGFGWRVIFLVNVPLGLLNLVLAQRYLPMDPARAASARADFDRTGTLLLALALVAYALAMTLGRAGFGWMNVALLLAAACGLGLFLRFEAGIASPLLPLARFREPALRAALPLNATVATVMMATLVVGPFYLSRALGLDPARVGLTMAVGPLISTLSGVLVGRGVDRWGAPGMVRLGLLEMAVGAGALAMLPARFGVAGYLAAILILTPGYQMFQAANSTAVMGDADPDQRGVISGLLSLSRNLGLITGASFMGAVFRFAAGAAELSTARPEAVASGLRATFGVAVVLVVLAAVSTGAWSSAPRGRALIP
jgi:MFS family permease